MNIDLAALTTGQIGVLAASATLAAAALAGTFGLVTALVNGWNARRQGREQALREYRHRIAVPLLERLNQRLQTWDGLILQAGAQQWDHDILLMSLYDGGMQGVPAPISLQMTVPFSIQDQQLRFFEYDMSYYRHLTADLHITNCDDCRRLGRATRITALRLREDLEDFIFLNRYQLSFLYERELKRRLKAASEASVDWHRDN